MSWVKLLQQEGYSTSMIGKWLLKTDPQGFDYWDILVGQGYYYNPLFIENGDTTQVEGYVTDLIMYKALDRLKSQDSSRPFAKLIHNKAPHRNWMPDSAHMELFNDREYPFPKRFLIPFKPVGRGKGAGYACEGYVSLPPPETGTPIL